MNYVFVTDLLLCGEAEYILQAKGSLRHQLKPSLLHPELELGPVLLCCWVSPEHLHHSLPLCPCDRLARVQPIFAQSLVAVIVEKLSLTLITHILLPQS